MAPRSSATRNSVAAAPPTRRPAQSATQSRACAIAHHRCAGGAEEKKCAKIAENPQPKYSVDSSGRLTWSPCYHHSCMRPWLAAHAAWAGEGGTYVAGAG